MATNMSANPNQFGAPLDQNQYMEQEEEWEREGLLDPAWEKQQRKVRERREKLYLKGPSDGVTLLGVHWKLDIRRPEIRIILSCI